MGYTHFRKIVGKEGIYVGAEGSEVQFANSTGSLFHIGTEITATAAEINKLDTVVATAAELNQREMVGRFSDVATATKHYLVSPVGGVITNVYTVLEGAIDSANCVITIKNAAGSTAGAITIAQSGSAAGDIDTVATSAANSIVTAGGVFTVETDGGSSASAACGYTVLITVT